MCNRRCREGNCNRRLLIAEIMGCILGNKGLRLVTLVIATCVYRAAPGLTPIIVLYIEACVNGKNLNA